MVAYVVLREPVEKELHSGGVEEGLEGESRRSRRVQRDGMKEY